MFTTARNCTLLQNDPAVGRLSPVVGSPVVGVLVLDMQPEDDLEYSLME